MKSITTPVSWATHKLESNSIPEVLPQEWKFSGVTGPILPWLGVWQLEEQPLERLVLKASRNWSQEFHSTGETEAALLDGAYQERAEKQWPHKNLDQTYLLVLEAGALIILKSCCMAKETIKKKKGHGWEKISANEVTYKGFYLQNLQTTHSTQQ